MLPITCCMSSSPVTLLSETFPVILSDDIVPDIVITLILF